MPKLFMPLFSFTVLVIVVCLFIQTRVIHLKPVQQVQSVIENKRTLVNRGEDGVIMTISHDGHLFVVYKYNGSSIIHHPQCTNSHCQ